MVVGGERRWVGSQRCSPTPNSPRIAALNLDRFSMTLNAMDPSYTFLTAPGLIVFTSAQSRTPFLSASSNPPSSSSEPPVMASIHACVSLNAVSSRWTPAPARGMAFGLRLRCLTRAYAQRPRCGLQRPAFHAIKRFDGNPRLSRVCRASGAALRLLSLRLVAAGRRVGRRQVSGDSPAVARWNDRPGTVILVLTTSGTSIASAAPGFP